MVDFVPHLAENPRHLEQVELVGFRHVELVCRGRKPEPLQGSVEAIKQVQPFGAVTRLAHGERQAPEKGAGRARL